eukprot:scaffold1361_cov165-Amphora_coffeaeformis.AAC.6
MRQGLLRSRIKFGHSLLFLQCSKNAAFQVDDSMGRCLHRAIYTTTRSSSSSRTDDTALNSEPLTATLTGNNKTVRILEFSSPEVDPRHRKEYVTILDPKHPEGWIREKYNPTANTPSTTNHDTSTTAGTVSNFLYDNGLKHFLPAQYPHSVSVGYSSYAAYSFGASIAGSAAMVLSTQTLLLAVGVVGSGSGHASVLAGALNWVLKDGVGQLGGVLYASFLGRTRRFDANPKRWRMMAALCLDLGTLLEILSPYAAKSSGLVLPLACVANVLKNMGFLTAGASRASLHQAMAIKGNLGDITAKAGSQATAAGLGGTSLGIGISTFLSSSASVETYVIAFCGLSVLHQVGNYLSVQSVPIPHFNNQRLHILLEDFCRNVVITGATSYGGTRVLTPEDVASQEIFLPWVSDTRAGDSHTWLTIGAKLSSLAPNGANELRDLVVLLTDEGYLVNMHGDGSIFVTFSADANGEIILQGMLHAYILRVHGQYWTPNKAISESLKVAKCQLPGMIAELQNKGWKLGTESFIIEHSEAIRYKVD